MPWFTRGKIDTTLIDSSSDTVYVGNDVDSMYGLRAFLRSNEESVNTEDNYNSSSIIVYRWTPGSPERAGRSRPAQANRRAV